MTRSGVITSSLTLLFYVAWFALLPVSIAANLPEFGHRSESTGCCSKGCCCARASSDGTHHCECCKKKGSCDCGLSSHDDAVKSILILRASALPRPARIRPAMRPTYAQLTLTVSPAGPDLVVPTPPPKPVFAG